jgi:hypothetical protein
VELIHDNSYSHSSEVVLSIDTFYGISRPKFEEEGVLVERIPYSDDFLTAYAEPIFYSHDMTLSEALHFIIFQQIYYGGRIRRGYDFTSDPGSYLGMYHLLGVTELPSPEGISEEDFNELVEVFFAQLVETFRGIGMIIAPNMYPVS